MVEVDHLNVEVDEGILMLLAKSVVTQTTLLLTVNVDFTTTSVIAIGVTHFLQVLMLHLIAKLT